ncbi:hypothetical protein MUK42_28404 [Musa troglodytarum]|uniref:Uncharacterized protein n=1 Tax=Musa troglodytarum TaxID=320322 RepID=A0A9E7FZP6_9LILI|nr:hypothetical protein MUK42_28404 [Musa troglodytarum]
MAEATTTSSWWFADVLTVGDSGELRATGGRTLDHWNSRLAEDPQYSRLRISLEGSALAQTLAVLWQNSACMASVAARAAQSIHTEVMRKLANLRPLKPYVPIGRWDEPGREVPLP